MESESEGQSTATTDEEGRTENQEADAPSGQQEEREGSASQEAGESQKSGDDEEDGTTQQGEQENPQASASQKEGESQEGDDDEDGDDEGGSSSNASIAFAVEDVSSLPGETVNDQDGRKIGEVKEIYAVGEDETPMWVTIESSTGLGRSRGVFVPLARIKKQADEFRVPYSYNHLHESPEVEPGDELSEEDDRALRAYYAIGLADQELVGSAQSYASQVPDDDGAARKVEASSAEGPVREIDKTPPAERVAEAYEKQKEEEGEEHRKGKGATAEDVFEEDGAGGSENKDDEDSEEDKSEAQSKSEDESKAESESESEDQPKDEEKQDQAKDEEKQEEPKDEEKQEDGG